MTIAEAGMKTDVPEGLLATALQLNPAQRESLALDLILSLEVQEDREPGYEEAWAAELERRMRSFRDGTAKTVSWEEVKARLRTPPSEARS
jgi:putative addiction module component (TIGR02574 family)